MFNLFRRKDKAKDKKDYYDKNLYRFAHYYVYNPSWNLQKQKIKDLIDNKDNNYLIELRRLIEDILKTKSKNTKISNDELINRIVKDEETKKELQDLRKRANRVIHSLDSYFDKSFARKDYETINKLLDYIKHDYN